MSQKTLKKHRCSEITSFSGAFLSLEVLPGLPRNFHTHTQKQLVCCVVTTVKCRCIAWCLAGLRELSTSSRRSSSPWAAGRLVSPRRKFFPIISNSSHSHTKPMFCNKNKEKNHIQRNFTYFPLRLFHQGYLFKKTKPQNWPPEQQSSQEVNLITSFFKIHPALHTCRLRQQS